MHELGITQDLVDLIVQQAAGRPVVRVRLRVGRLSGLDPEALRFCFGPCSAGTIAASATLEIETVPGQGRCQRCGATFPLGDYVGLCPACGNSHLDISGGDDLVLAALEVEQCA